MENSFRRKCGLSGESCGNLSLDSDPFFLGYGVLNKACDVWLAGRKDEWKVQVFFVICDHSAWELEICS